MTRLRLVWTRPKPASVVDQVEGLIKECWTFAGNVQRLWLLLWGIER